MNGTGEAGEERTWVWRGNLRDIFRTSIKLDLGLL